MPRSRGLYPAGSAHFEKGEAQQCASKPMLQHPDHSPPSYWQFDPRPEQDVQEEEAGVAAAGKPAAVVPSAVQPVDQGVAWQTPAASEPAPAMTPQASSPLRSYPGRPRRRHPLLGILLVLLVVVLLGVAGSVSGLQVARLASQHGQVVAPPTARLGPVPSTPRGSSADTPTTRPAASPTPKPTAVVPSPTPQQRVILAQDDFQRPNQALWGTASDGSVWGGDANTAPVFSIVAGTGRITGGQGFFNALLGPRTVSEVLSSGSVSHFDNLRDNLGVVLHWTNNDNYYKAYLDGASLILIKRVAGTVTRLGAVPFSAQDGVSYSLRFRVAGSQLLVRAWQSEASEPATWMIVASDSALTYGFGGLRVLLEPGITMTITMFQERSLA